MKYAQMRQFDIANGEGIGCTLFVSGCSFNCKGCFNKEYQDFNHGNEWTKETEDRFIKMCKNPQVDHISLLGGEPLQQDIGVLTMLLIRLCYEVKKPIWLWTGYTWEQIPESQKALLREFVDVLIDGRFIESEKDLTLAYKGSKNQRIINVKETMKKGEIVLWR